jgi:hypothetical protein
MPKRAEFVRFEELSMGYDVEEDFLFFKRDEV